MNEENSNINFIVFEYDSSVKKMGSEPNTQPHGVHGETKKKKSKFSNTNNGMWSIAVMCELSK